ncbi:MAG: hypothetical protein QE274_07425 [Verrucomicrobiaceae bacterium]|nr:hypothetical protein [Verrucomicrobiaceae bacterium]
MCEFRAIQRREVPWNFIVLWQKGRASTSTSAFVDTLKQVAAKVTT